MKLFPSIAAASLLLSLAACGGQSTTASNPTTSSPTTAQSPMSDMTAQSPTSSPSAAATTSANTEGKVTVTETEMAIALSNTTLPAGPTTFVVQNKGKESHELVVFKTDLPLAQLPTKGGKLDEDNPKLQNVADTGETELKSNETRSLQANLTPGHYVAICNVEDHFAMGMKAEFTVK